VRLDTSIVVAWRRRVNGGRCDLATVEEEALRAARDFVSRVVREGGVVGYDILFAGLGAALSVLTRCDSIVTPKGALDAKGLAEVAYRVAGRAVAEALAGFAGATVASAPGRFYLITRTLFAEAGEIRLDGSSIGLLQVALGVKRDDLVELAILGRGRDVYPLLYPRQVRTAADLERLLRQRGLDVDPGRAVLRSSVDVLHLLYYGAAKGRLSAFVETLRMRAGGLFDEALGIARALCKLLPRDNPERGLACKVAGGSGGGLDTWLKKG
jgi:adenine-specific DNA methylase